MQSQRRTSMLQSTQDIASDTRIVGANNDSYPLVICFHGSGGSCASWEPLANSLSNSYRILLWDRRDSEVKPSTAVTTLLGYLDEAHLSSSFVIVAHSYGGTFARLFLEQRPHQVAGMVLVETGQETAIDSKVEKRQYDNQILGNKPLVVIRGNTLVDKWREYNEKLTASGTTSNPILEMQKQLLDATDKEDERLKKAQLQLSRNHKYVHIPDCGHGVISQRPEAVREAVDWVMEHLYTQGGAALRDDTHCISPVENETASKKGIGARLKGAKSIFRVKSVSKLFRKSDN
ncbi:alpha beta hydrolase [Fusarium heterosporum]|uniref:Alpha beta hydrolase n=1 Tax=Fusarium heterosporum TaxID=42747 RepID=A0A8H5T4Z5_FUSHE|nr:alpha beta hydrolase [Fusarium heterosporum]